MQEFIKFDVAISDIPTETCIHCSLIRGGGYYIRALYGKIGKQKYCNFWKEQIFWKLFSDLESARRDLSIGINKRKK